MKKQKARIMSGEVRLELTLPGPWISRDKWEKMHFGAKGRLIETLATQYRIQIEGLGLELPLINVTIDATRINSGQLDDDNLKSGLKPYIDAMTERHMRGMGLILDDRPAIITGGINATQYKCKRAEPGSSVFIVAGTQTRAR